MLIIPPSLWQVIKAKATIYPPLGLGYLASCLEQAGHNVRIVDSIVLNHTMESLKKEIRQFDPDVIGITATTSAIYDALRVARLAKENNPNCTTVLGGAHVTFMSKETLEEYPYVDVVVRGEGERTFVELLEKKKCDWKDVKGISFRLNSKIIENGDRGFIDDLDDLPFPAYHLMSIDKYITHENLFDNRTDGKPFGGIFTGRGCPYSCAFCSSRKLTGKRWRVRNPEYIVEEIKILTNKYNKKEIEILDDTFVIDEKRVEKICNLIRKESIDISWLCETRVNLFNRKIASLIKRSGCHTVAFGIESGVQKTLNFLNKGITLEQAEKAVRIAQEFDLDVQAFFIIGIPGETKEMIETTISFAKKLNPNIALFHLLTPYPGTKIYEMAKENNLLLTEDWSKYNHTNPIMKIPGLTENELKKLYAKAYRSFYFKPSSMYKILKETHVVKNVQDFFKR